MKKNTSILLILIIILSTLQTSATTPSHQNTRTTSTDIPTWYIGDEWTSIIHPITYTSPNGSFSGTITNFKQTVTNILSLHHQGNIYTTYKIHLQGTITGELTYESLSGDLQGTITGTTYIRQADLSELKTIIQSQGTITILFINQPYTLTSINEFNPLLELHDFPINTEESWNTCTYTTNTITFTIGDLVNDTYTSNGWVNETISCTNQETITVPAGNFNTYKLHHGTTNAWYAPDTGNIIKTHINQTTENTTLQLTQSLTSYNLIQPPITLTTEITPNPSIINHLVNITGYATNTTSGEALDNIPITLTIPQTSDQYTTTTYSTGRFIFTIPTPNLTDYTQTTYDIASDGIHIHGYIPNSTIESYLLTTLIIRYNEAPTIPLITGPNKGKINTQYTYEFKGTDPDNDPLHLFVDWGDTTNTTWLGPYSSGETIPIKHTWTNKNTYTIRCKIKDSFNEESPWALYEIEMPQTNKMLLQRFPIIHFLLANYQFPLLTRIMNNNF